MLQKPVPFVPGYASTLLTCEWPDTQAIAFGYWCIRSVRSWARWIGVDALGSRSQPGLMSWPWAGSLMVHGGAASYGTSALRLAIAWWLRITTSWLAAFAFASSDRSHWNYGSSTLPSADGPARPPSERVSSVMKRKPGTG